MLLINFLQISLAIICETFPINWLLIHLTYLCRSQASVKQCINIICPGENRLMFQIGKHANKCNISDFFNNLIH